MRNGVGRTLKNPVILLVICIFGWFAAERAHAEPPFSGTIFLDPDIITDTDPTTFTHLVDSGQAVRRMFDRRVNGWVSVNAFLFNANYSDGLVSEIQVNPEFGNRAGALEQASRFAPVIGRLPTCLRADVQTVWIHKGIQPFGGGNHNLLIHTGQADVYEASGILEETLVHEATHTSLDAAHAAAKGWVAAQKVDDAFISTYARDYPDREDLAESFLLYMTLRHRSNRISETLSNTIARTIPNRIAYLDGLDLEMNPSVPRARPRATGFIHDPKIGIVGLTWTSRRNVDYAVEVSTDLVTWNALGGNVVSQGSLTRFLFPDPLPRPNAFVVVRELVRQ